MYVLPGFIIFLGSKVHWNDGREKKAPELSVRKSLKRLIMER